MEDKYESKTIPVLTDEKKKYYIMQMGGKQDSEESIKLLDIQRAKLHELEFEIEERDFMNDVLTKMPSSSKTPRLHRA